MSRLARVLGIEFHIDITPDAFGLRETARSADPKIIAPAADDGCAAAKFERPDGSIKTMRARRFR